MGTALASYPVEPASDGLGDVVDSQNRSDDPGSSHPGAAPLALVNARVLTPVRGGDRTGTPLARADAVLVRDGAIVTVGSNDEIRRRAPRGTEFVDVHGRAVLPGFVDAHIHPIFYGLSLQGVVCLPPRVASIADLQREVRARVAGAADGAWIWGQGYDDTRLVERRHPTRFDLDAASAGHPVVVTRVCGHMCVASSRALELAGIDARTPDPAGGSIERDATGEPTGLLLETAEQLVLRHVSMGRADVLAALGRVSDDLLAHGITACCDAWLGYSEGADEYDIWAEALRSNVFRPRISFLVHHDLWRESPPPEGLDAELDVLGVKLVADGSISGGSAGLEDPFVGDDDRRLFVFDPDALDDICVDVGSHGLRIAIHAMGDRAISMALDAIDRSRAARPHAGAVGTGRGADRIEHCTLPSRRDIERMARSAVTPVMQPIFLFAEGEAYLSGLGTERSMWANPARAMIDSGVRVAMGSDAPATTWGEPTDVMLAIQTSVERRTWRGSSLGTDQATSVEEAIAAYTANAAHASGFGATLGYLEPRGQADLVVLSDDPTRVPTAAIRDVAVTGTILAGELVSGEL
jgi:predicted amidohydrolase YtcJ